MRVGTRLSSLSALSLRAPNNRYAYFSRFAISFSSLLCKNGNHMEIDSPETLFVFFNISQSSHPERMLDFVTVDWEAATCCRNLILLDLMIAYGDEILKSERDGWGDPKGFCDASLPPWLGQMWNLFFNHYITSDEYSVLQSSARRLLAAMETPETWEATQLGKRTTLTRINSDKSR